MLNLYLQGQKQIVFMRLADLDRYYAVAIKISSCGL